MSTVSWSDRTAGAGAGFHTPNKQTSPQGCELKPTLPSRLLELEGHFQDPCVALGCFVAIPRQMCKKKKKENILILHFRSVYLVLLSLILLQNDVMSMCHPKGSSEENNIPKQRHLWGERKDFLS